jgi:hypothetical protein
LLPGRLAGKGWGVYSKMAPGPTWKFGGVDASSIRPPEHARKAATARLKGSGVCQFARLIEGGELKIVPPAASAHCLQLDTRPLHAPMHPSFHASVQLRFSCNGAWWLKQIPSSPSARKGRSCIPSLRERHLCLPSAGDSSPKAGS